MPPEHYSPSHAASTAGVSASTIRAWCLQFQAYLSPNARPSTGKERRLTANDVAILQTVRQLRDEGKSIAEIADHLAETPTEALQPFVDVPTNAQPATTITQSATAQERQDLTPALAQVVFDLESRFDAKLAALYQAKVNDRRLVRDGVFMFMAGGVTVLLFVLIVIVVVDLWAK